MREIKFRAWDKTMHKMIHQDDTEFEFRLTGKGIEVDDLTFVDTAFNKKHEDIDCEIMQYTGFKDKKGKEIYEGDIVTFTYVGEPKKRNKQYELKTNKEKVGVIIYDDYDCCYYIEFLSLWKGMYDVELYKDLTYKKIKDVDNLEVIGNIYENVDLLELEEGICV